MAKVLSLPVNKIKILTDKIDNFFSWLCYSEHLAKHGMFLLPRCQLAATLSMETASPSFHDDIRAFCLSKHVTTSTLHPVNVELRIIFTHSKKKPKTE